MGIHANCYDGSYHEVDSSEMAFQISGSMAFKEAMQKGDAVLLEPIMKVEVTMPEEYMGDVIGSLNAKRGQIEGMDDLGGGKHLFRLLRCLVIPQSSALQLRDVVTIPCSLRDMRNVRKMFRKKS